MLAPFHFLKRSAPAIFPGALETLPQPAWHLLAGSRVFSGYMPLPKPSVNVLAACAAVHRRYEFSFRWYTLIILTSHVVFFRVTSVLLAKYVNFLKR